MANDLNKVLLIARLTRDPEYKTINGTSLVNYSVASNRVYMVNGEKREETNFFDCEAWGKTADIIRQYATKGKQVMIEGRLKQDSWESPEGKKMSKIKIFTENLQLLGSAGGGSGSGGYSGDRGGSQSGNSSPPDYLGGDTGSYGSNRGGSEFDRIVENDDEPF